MEEISLMERCDWSIGIDDVGFRKFISNVEVLTFERKILK